MLNWLNKNGLIGILLANNFVNYYGFNIFLVVTPCGLIVRIFKKDLMGLKIKKNLIGLKEMKKFKI